MAVEKFVSLTVRGVKKPFKRFYDLTDGLLHYEIKNWSWKSFPPALGDQLRWRALRGAGKQWIRDVAYHGLNAGPEGIRGRLRYVFPSALKPFEKALKSYFVNALNAPTLKKYMLGDHPTQADLDRYGTTMSSVIRFIDDIIVFHP